MISDGVIWEEKNLTNNGTKESTAGWPLASMDEFNNIEDRLHTAQGRGLG
jgi:hypothetical protein